MPSLGAERQGEKVKLWGATESTHLPVFTSSHTRLGQMLCARPGPNTGMQAEDTRPCLQDAPCPGEDNIGTETDPGTQCDNLCPRQHSGIALEGGDQGKGPERLGGGCDMS